MSYNPLEFWKDRHVPDTGISKQLEEYVKKHIQGAERILDFGVGTGRLLPLFAGKKVYGYDIIDRGVEGIVFIDDFESLDIPFFDVVVASKVFLHIPPYEMDSIMWDLSINADKMIVYDTHKEMKAEHCFTHDFSEWGKMHDIVKDGDDLYFVYQGDDWS